MPKGKEIVENTSSSDSGFKEVTYVPWQPSLKAQSKCHTNDCAKWANDELRNYKDLKSRTLYTNENIGGDAWTRLTSGINHKMIYSGYEGMDYNPSSYSEEKSNERNHKAADNFLRNFNSKILDK